MFMSLRVKIESYKDAKFELKFSPTLRSLDEYTKDVVLNKDTVRKLTLYIRINIIKDIYNSYFLFLVPILII